MPVTHWRSMSVVAPFCVVAGSLATIGMLLEREAPAFLDAQGASWIGVDADGTLRGPATG
jgi:thiamine biosynthesis lipoprotein